MNTENILPITLELLPVEIFLEIFAFLPPRELVTHFSGLNTHIDSIIRCLRSVSHVVRYNDTDALKILQLFSTQISHLVVVNVEMVDFTLLTNIRSLTLKFGTSVQFDSIRPQNMPMLEILHIKALHTTANPNTVSINNLFQVILSNSFSRLRICTAFDIGDLEFNSAWTGSPTLRALNLNMKTAIDYERLHAVCPQLRRFTTYNYSMGKIPQRGQFKGVERRMFSELRKLEGLESKNIFILDENPMALFGCKMVPARFNNTVSVPRLYVKDITRFQGRILPQSDPYCRASFLVQIELPQEYPFKMPEITFLDPIYHPNVDKHGGHCFCWDYSLAEDYKPTTSIVEIIEHIIQLIDSPDYNYVANIECSEECKHNYEIFYKKALENTLLYGRPRY